MQHAPTMRRVSAQLFAAALVLLSGAACKGNQQQEYGGVTADTTPAGAEMPVTPGAPSPALADGNIAAILSASGLEEIEPSQVAVKRAENTSVREFAQRMVTDHTKLNESLNEILKKQNISPAGNDMSSQIQSETKRTVQSIQGMSGAAFDRAYMQAMVNSHQKSLDAIDQQLIPAAQNAQLESEIREKVKPMFQDHLERAKKIQSTLGT